MREVPLLLYEAVLSLYPPAADGTPLRDRPLWWGAVANGLNLSSEFEEARMAGLGDRYQTAHHVDEAHTVDVDRTWLLPKFSAPGQDRDFTPGRNTHYVMELVWAAPEGVWYRRTYFDVTGRAASWASQGAALHFSQRQSYRATHYEQDSDYVQPPVHGSGVPPTLPPVLPPGSVTTPLLPDEQAVGFFREAPMVTGEYLLGHYRWGQTVQLNGVTLVALAPQVTPQVVALEIDGSTTGQPRTLTIPTGMANTPVTVTADLGGLTVGAGQTVRWKITSGPAPEDAAWQAALSMQVQPL